MRHKGVRVNALSPGAVETGRMLYRHGTMEAARAASVPLHPIGRLGRPEEIGEAALFLGEWGFEFYDGGGFGGGWGVYGGLIWFWVG